MRKMIMGNVLMTLGLLCSCSSEQSFDQPVRMDRLQNTGCKFALSKTESRPEFYAEEMEKVSRIKVDVDAKGTVTFSVMDLRENCAVREIRPQVKSEGKGITIVLFPYSDDPTLEMDCYCSYDVSFNLLNLVEKQYNLKVYRSDAYGKYNALKPAYEGNVSFAPNSSLELPLE